jgi:hypothetical protein
MHAVGSIHAARASRNAHRGLIDLLILTGPAQTRGKLQRGGTPCGNNLSCCCPVRLGGAAGLAGAGADASAAGAASAGAAVATTGFLQSVSQTS